MPSEPPLSITLANTALSTQESSLRIPSSSYIFQDNGNAFQYEIDIAAIGA
jgi:hypothetical protein